MRKSRILFGIGLYLVLTLVSMQPLAHAAPGPAASCDNLNLRLSDDKNFYVFTASTSGDTAAISSYTFDFGDRQSYRVTMPNDRSDRSTALATHSYQTAGAYTASVRVRLKNGSDVTSPACRTPITILPAGAELPNTGVRRSAELFAATAVTATGLHQLVLRHRLAKPRRRPTADPDL